MIVKIKKHLKLLRFRLKALKSRLSAGTRNAEGIRSNLDVWKKLQDKGYFENHPCYKGISDFGGQEAVQAIEWFTPIRADMKIAVIGCGYGRETLKLAPLVKDVYGIDVSKTILKKAVAYLSDREIKNFIPVLAESFAREIPSGLDLVFSIVVMQHLTRDLVRNYFVELGSKLVLGGGFVVQFLDEAAVDYESTDAPEHEGGEPSISWSHWQLVELSRTAKLTLVEIRTQLVTDTALWHWAYFRKDA